MKKQGFTVLKVTDLHPFPDNPFRVVEDELLLEMAESIKEFGMVTPIITRPKEDGNGYEVIAGQRRVRATQLAGIDKMCIRDRTYGGCRNETDYFKCIWRPHIRAD